MRHVKHESVSGSSFCPSRANDVGKCNTCIVCGLEFQTTELTWVNEVVGYDNELESLSNYFFDKFAKSV